MISRQRALWAIIFLSFGFTLVSLRLVQIQLIDHERYWKEAIANHCRRVELPARRGTILDRNGNILAQTYQLYNLRVDNKLFFSEQQAAEPIAQVLGISPEEFLKSLNHNDRNQVVRTGLTEDTISKLKDLKVRSLIFELQNIRGYPNNNLGSHLLGFLDQNEHGAMGVEKAMDSYLCGIPGERWIEKDARRREIAAYRGRDTEPKDGMTVSLTIDLAIQHVVEDEMDKLMAKYQPEGVCVIVMQPKTGEILAMGNRPTFDPNKRDAITSMAVLRNRCLNDLVEPGSTFKIVTTAAAINERLVNLDTPIYCENGKFFYAGYTLHDDEPKGMLPVWGVLKYSSNIGTAKIALSLGEDRLYYYAYNFGFGQKTNLLPGQGETAGLLYPVSKWSKLEITRIPIGQGVGATPIQMVSAICAIANGGRLMVPHLIRNVTDTQGRVVQSTVPQVIRQVVRPSTAGIVSEALVRVCEEEGTGARAVVPGFTTAGKTGTAQVAMNGEYVKGKYVASFIGFFPEEDPQVAMLVLVNQPTGKDYYAASVAAPAFAEIGQQVAQCLNLTPKTAELPPTQRASL